MAHIHIPNEIPTRYLARNKTATTISVAMVVVGAAAFLLTLGSNPGLAWKSYVVNWIYFLSLAMGAVMVAVATWVTKAKWNWSVRRLHLSFVGYLPIAFVLVLPMLAVLREDYFPWMEMMATDPLVQKKAAYLNIPFLIARNAAGLLLMFGFALGFTYLGLRPDMGRGGDDSDAGRSTWRERLMGNWSGQDQEEDRSYARMTRMGPALGIIYAVVMSVIITDWAMSLEPHWLSTLFGGWFFMGAFWSGIALTALMAVYLKAQNGDFDKHIGTQQLWDLGKLLFAFCVFWTYLFWSQYIVIWYGKLPWEQAWVIRRSGETWGFLSLLVIILCFIVPFMTLLGAKPKRTPSILRFAAVVVLAGVWLWHYMLIFPSLHHEGDPVFSIMTPAIGLLFLGLFRLTNRWFLTTFPVIQVWQPKPDPEPLEAETSGAAALV